MKKTPHNYSHGIRCLSCEIVLEYEEDIWRRTTKIYEDGIHQVELVCQECFFQAPGGCPSGL